MGDRHDLIGELQQQVGAPVIVVAAGWREDIAVDLDLDAARVFHESLTRADIEAGEEVAVLLIGKGSYPGFADAVWRALRSTCGGYQALIPYFCTGASTLLALGASKIVLHPLAGLGAFDAGPIADEQLRLDAHIFDDVPALGGVDYQHDQHLPARLAHGYQVRRHFRTAAERVLEVGEVGGNDILTALSARRLGHEQGLSVPELDTLGLSAELADGATADTMWRLFRLYEEELGLRSTPPPRYTESDIADEVEFEMAVGLTGAVIESSEQSYRYVLDTGRPDPDTGRYAGEWEWDLRE